MKPCAANFSRARITIERADVGEEVLAAIRRQRRRDPCGRAAGAAADFEHAQPLPVAGNADDGRAHGVAQQLVPGLGFGRVAVQRLGAARSIRRETAAATDRPSRAECQRAADRSAAQAQCARATDAGRAAAAACRIGAEIVADSARTRPAAAVATQQAIFREDCEKRPSSRRVARDDARAWSARHSVDTLAGLGRHPSSTKARRIHSVHRVSSSTNAADRHRRLLDATSAPKRRTDARSAARRAAAPSRHRRSAAFGHATS